MGLVEFAAAKTLASSAVFLFITVLLIAAAKRTSTCIVLFGVQCAVITAQIMAVAFLHHSGEAFVVGAMVFVVKVLAIPYALLRIRKRLNVPGGVIASTTPAQSVYIAAGLILGLALGGCWLKDQLVTADDVAGFEQLEARGAEHDRMIGMLADVGHKLGMQVWIGRRQQTRRVDGKPLAALVGCGENHGEIGFGSHGQCNPIGDQLP